MSSKEEDIIICPVSDTLDFFNRKCILCLLMDMFRGLEHFTQFQKSNPSLSNHILSKTLREMEDKNLIRKIEVPDSINTTRYELTSKGMKVNKILYELTVFSLEELETSKLCDETKKKLLSEYKSALF